MTGQIFGKLTVLKQVEDHICPCGRHNAQWLCECSCKEHNQIIVIGTNLTRKNGTRSCGCLLKKTNSYNLNREYGIGLAYNTNNEFYFDLEDYDKIKDVCWTECTRHGMQCLVGTDRKTNKLVTMHSFLGYSNYDHANRNELDNRKCNLRPCSPRENVINRNRMKNNTSGIIGVSWNKKLQKWRVRVFDNDGKEISIGFYNNFQDAVVARLKAEIQYYGEFAPQRHLFDEYEIFTLNN